MQIKTSEAVEKASGILRAVAVKKGFDIDEKYRSVAGMWNRFLTLQAMYEEKKISGYHGTQVFREAIELYRNNRKEYHKFLREAASLLPEESDWFCETGTYYSNTNEEISDDWILFDFTNEVQFTRTRPVWCSIQGENIEGKTWSQILAAIVNREIKKENPAIDDLYLYALLDIRSDKPFLMKNKLDGLNCRQLENGYWINVNYSLPHIMKLIKELCIHCGYNKGHVVLYGVSKNEHKDTSKEIENMERIIDAVHRFYANGFRFDETAIHLLEQASSIKIDLAMQNVLKKTMFRRNDHLYFLPDMVVGQTQLELLAKEKLLNEISRCGCADLGVLFLQYNSSGNVTYLRNEDDFKDFLMFLLPNEIRIGNALKTRIVRKTGMSVNDALEIAASKVVATIEVHGCITQEDLQIEYPLFSKMFIHRLLEKYADTVLPTVINDFLCYQTVESMGLGDEFSAVLRDSLDELVHLSLAPSQEIIHALLSIKLGYNLRDEYSIPDDKTFRHIISAYYDGSKQREWKSGNFLEVNSENV